VTRREDESRQLLAAQLMRALQHLNLPSRLSESPLCKLDGVRRQATALGGYRYPRARVVIRAVRQAYDAAWAELADTGDARYLETLADALSGVSRAASARRAGVSPRELTRWRRAAIEIIVDECLVYLRGS
jgi:hypothetical protein